MSGIHWATIFNTIAIYLALVVVLLAFLAKGRRK